MADPVFFTVHGDQVFNPRTLSVLERVQVAGFEVRILGSTDEIHTLGDAPLFQRVAVIDYIFGVNHWKPEVAKEVRGPDWLRHAKWAVLIGEKAAASVGTVCECAIQIPKAFRDLERCSVRDVPWRKTSGNFFRHAKAHGPHRHRKHRGL